MTVKFKNGTSMGGGCGSGMPHMMMKDEDIVKMIEVTPDMYKHAYEYPWYGRTAIGRSGNFFGHFLPAFFFTVFGLGYLLLSLKRARSIGKQQSFTQLHVPERNPVVLRTVGVAGMTVTTIGFIMEMAGGILEKHNPFLQLAHESLYFSYFLVALCAFLESKGRLPLDTHRAGMVLALVASYLMWHSHGTMKLLMADQQIHILLSYINLSNAAVVAYSMRFTDSAIAFIAGYAGFILQGGWLILAGFYECCYDLPMHEIATYLAVQCLVLFMLMVITVALFGPEQSEQDNPTYRGNFSPLRTTAGATGNGMNGHDDDDAEFGYN